MTTQHGTGPGQDLTDLQVGDLVRLRPAFGWLDGRFAGKIVEIVHIDRYDDGLVVYTGQLKVRGTVAFPAIPFVTRDVAMRTAGWCSTAVCAAPVAVENEICARHHWPHNELPPDSLVRLSHQLYAGKNLAFPPVHLGGTNWGLLSEDDPGVVMVLTTDNVCSYTSRGWDEGDDALVEVLLDYDDETPGDWLQASLKAITQLRNFYQAAYRFMEDAR